MYKKKSDVIYRIIDNECILLDLKSSVYYGLNETGTEIWKRVDGEKDVSSITKDICKIYNTNYEVTLKDVIELFDDLEKEGLLEKI